MPRGLWAGGMQPEKREKNNYNQDSGGETGLVLAKNVDGQSSPLHWRMEHCRGYLFDMDLTEHLDESATWVPARREMDSDDGLAKRPR